MTTFRRPRTCRKCGATFEASPADRTVNCPAHRGRPMVTGPMSRFITTCFCGKTVTAVNGTSTGATCPRECHA